MGCLYKRFSGAVLAPSRYCMAISNTGNIMSYVKTLIYSITVPANLLMRIIEISDYIVAREHIKE